MKKDSVVIVNTGVANIASVKACLERFDIGYVSADNPSSIASAKAVVLPGVGTFGAAMQSLKEAGFIEPLQERIVSGKPTFAICVGLQLLCAGSEESPGVDGLKIFPYTVSKFKDSVRIPHFGWNKIESKEEDSSEGYGYFANSYRMTDSPEGWKVSWCDYGGPFVAMVQRGGVFATQFHPELSGEYGKSLFATWLKEAQC